MKRITKINDNEYISKEVEHTTSLTGTIIELIIYLSLLAALTKFVNIWLQEEINMKVYEIIEHNKHGKNISHGIYNKKETAITYMDLMGWSNITNFEIIEHQIGMVIKRR